jgi:small-conductance mechanosensitive channel
VRLSPGFRAALYGAFSVLFLTGASWLLADRLKDGPDGDAWQSVAADLLMVHGGAAMAALMLLGALAPLHVARAWRAKRNRLTGPAMVAFNAVLIATAFGLYYLGSDLLRPWISDIHIAAGLALPALTAAHVLIGRRRRPSL